MSVILRDDSNATATLLEGAGYALGDVAGSVSLDEGGAPHVVGALTIPLPADAELLDLLDPRQHRRVRIDVTRERVDGFGSTSSRSFDLGLREADIDEGAATMQLRLESDEALAMDDVLLADDPVSMHAYQGSIRSLVDAVLARIGAALEPGAPDPSIQTTSDATNLMTNPSAETSLTNAAAAFVTLTRSNAWAAAGAGAWSFQLAGPFGADSYLEIGGNDSAHRLGMRAGATYTVAGTLRLTGAVGSSVASARTIRVVGRDAGGTPVQIAQSAAAPDAAGVTRVSLTFTIPAGYQGSSIRWYHGGTSGTVWWDALSLREVRDAEHADPTDTVYFDGATTDTTDYEYAWTGTAGESSSTRIALVDRPVASLWWEPGRSAWEFLSPIVQAAGLRLFCDELRDWRLVDGAGYVAPGMTQLTQGVHLTSARTSVSRDGEWHDAALVRYRWRQADGTQAERIDWYAAPGYTRARTFDIAAPYPGPGRARYKVTRAEGLGRTATVEAPLDLSIVPSQPLRLTLPDIPELFGLTRSVEHDLDTFTSRIESRGLTDVPPGAWVLVDPALVWNDAPPALVWADATPDDSTIFD